MRRRGEDDSLMRHENSDARPNMFCLPAIIIVSPDDVRFADQFFTDRLLDWLADCGQQLRYAERVPSSVGAKFYSSRRKKRRAP
jgi:hypothetical protein